jgi:hypothetical protein
MTEVITNLTNQYPWLVVTVFAILILLILSIVGIVLYAVITGRPIKLWIIEIGPGDQKLNGDHEQKKDFNKLLAVMDLQLRPLLSFVEERTRSLRSVPQADFDPPRFPNYAYWMLGVCLTYPA